MQSRQICMRCHEPEVKEQAEAHLSAWHPGVQHHHVLQAGHPPAGTPFEVKLPEHPLDVSRMTAEQMDTGTGEGLCPDEGPGQVIPAKQAFDELRGELGV